MKASTTLYYYMKIYLTYYYEYLSKIRRGSAAGESFKLTLFAEAKTQVAEAPRKHWRKHVMSRTNRRPGFDTAQMQM